MPRSIDPGRNDHLVQLVKDEHWTLEEAAELYDISKERVRQILEERGVKAERPRRKPKATVLIVRPKRGAGEGDQFYKEKGYTSVPILKTLNEALKELSYDLSYQRRERVSIIGLVHEACIELIKQHGRQVLSEEEYEGGEDEL